MRWVNRGTAPCRIAFVLIDVPSGLIGWREVAGERSICATEKRGETMQTNVAAGGTRYFIPGLARGYEALGDFSWALLRVLYGAFYIPHGMQKLFGAWGGNIEGLAKAIDGRMGWHPGVFWAHYIGCLEFFGGILLVLGLLTRPVALLFCGFMFVAAVQFNTQAWWWTQSGREMPLLLLGIALVILIRGGGPYSLDRKFGREF